MKTVEDTEGHKWTRSSHCKQCIEVSPRGEKVFLRDAEQPERTIEVPLEEFRSFLKGVKEGEFDNL